LYPGSVFQQRQLLGQGYSIHALPGRKPAWGPRVKLGDLAGLESGAFVNLVAVPAASETSRSVVHRHAEAR
jgi:hypothetical protein